MEFSYRKHFDNCKALTELEFFELDAEGRPGLAVDLPPIVDFHAHLGISFLMSRPVELLRAAEPVRHCFRHDELPVDLSLYSGVNLRNTRRNGTLADYGHTLFTNRGANSTYTIPGLLEEMDRMGVDKSVILAIDLPVMSRNSQRQLEAVADNPRLIPFCAVNCRSPRWEEEMDRCLELGARGLKVHPYSQLAPPDHPRMMRLMERWSRTRLPILFHTANNGLEPSFFRKLSEMELYEAPLRRFPETTFILGHAGMYRYKDAMRMAREHGNTFLEIGGHPPEHIRDMIDSMGPEWILFGTDWPFYPLILPLAKTLIATADDPEARRMILSDNAHRIIESLGLDKAGGRVARKAGAAMERRG